MIHIVDDALQFQPTHAPLLIHMNQKEHTLVAQEDVNTKSFTIESADLSYYRKRNSDVNKSFDQRQKLYTPVKKHCTDRRDHADVDADADADPYDDVALAQVLHELRTDNQNVHDSTIQKTIKQMHDNLEENNVLGPVSNSTEVINEIQDYTRANGSANKYSDVKFVLDRLQERNASIVNLQDTELGVLKKVWENGNDNVRSQVVNELIDCKHDVLGKPSIYCPTGVVTRIMSATAIENPEAMPRTKGMLREEMMNTAAKLRDDLENTPEYANKSHHEQHDYFKKKLIDTFDKQYEGVLDEKTVREEMNQWIDHV